MNVEVVSATELSTEQLAAWDQLQQLDPAARHPFLRPEFTQLAGRECPGCQVAVVQLAGQYVGFFPFQRAGRSVARAIAWQMSDMHGIVLCPGVSIDARQLLRQAGLQAWHFDHVPVDQATFRRYVRCVDDSYYMDLSGGYDAYVTQLRKSRASFLTQAARKLRKLSREVGPLRFDFHTTNEQVFTALTGWKRQQLQQQGYQDTLALPWVEPLLRQVAFHQTPRFSGVLSALYAGRVLVAVHLGVRSGPELCSWVPAYNPSYARYSPGVLVHLELARTAGEEAIHRIDLGRGENRLKSSLCSGMVPVAIGSVERRPWRAVGNAAWYGARTLAYSLPLLKTPLKIYRRLRDGRGLWQTRKRQPLSEPSPQKM